MLGAALGAPRRVLDQCLPSQLHHSLSMSIDKQGSQGTLGGAGAGVLGAGGMAGTAGASLPSSIGGPAADAGARGASIGLAPTLASGGGGGGDEQKGLTAADLSAREGGPGTAQRAVDEHTPMSEVGAGRGAPAGSQEVPAAGFGGGGGGRPLAGGASGGAGADLGAAGQDAGGCWGRWGVHGGVGCWAGAGGRRLAAVAPASCRRTYPAAPPRPLQEWHELHGVAQKPIPSHIPGGSSAAPRLSL